MLIMTTLRSDHLHVRTTPVRKAMNRGVDGSSSEEDGEPYPGKGPHDALSSPESLSSSSSKATIRADRDSDQGPSSDEDEREAGDVGENGASATDDHEPIAGPSMVVPAWSGDLRARSISAPSSRSSSFQRNLDQLALQSQSAHHFPAVLHSSLSTAQSERGDAEQSVLVSSSLQSGRPGSALSSSGGSIRSRASSRSMPSSPQLAPRRAGGHAGASPRPRSSIFATGSGFTPATEAPLPHGHAAKTVGRTRSTSASEPSYAGYPMPREASTSSSMTSSPAQPARQRSHSARTSPALRPLQPLTPAEGTRPASSAHPERPQPQRVHSTPHLPQVSPVFYGLGIPCGTYNGSTVYATSPGAQWDGYFTLPPPVLPTNRVRSDDDSPPPYTPSSSNLVALANVPDRVASQARPLSRNNSRSQRAIADNSDENDDSLSFSTRGRGRIRPQRSLQGARLAQSHDEQVMRTAASVQNDTSVDSSGQSHSTIDGLDAEQRQYIYRLEHPSKLRQFVLTYLIHPLRLLAAVPGCVGTFWLLRNAAIIYMRDGTLLFKDKRALQIDIAARPSGLEFALSALWSLATAFHALSFTTLLLRRWLHYYSLLPSLIRLVALQAICWPLVRLTLHILGPLNPLPGWVIVSSTTAFSDTVARWVVSNITDESTAFVDGAGLNDTRADAHGAMHPGRRRRRYRTRRNGRVHRAAMVFWRTIMGAPPRQPNGRVYANTVAGERGFITESDADIDSDMDGSCTSLTRSQRLSSSRHQTLASLRRRHASARSADDLTGDDTDQDGRSTTSRPEHATAFHERRIERVGRIFHWDVAVKRNLLPLCILAYMTMWALLLEVTRSRW